MKKFIKNIMCLMLCITACFGLVGCKNNENVSGGGYNETTSSTTGSTESQNLGLKKEDVDASAYEGLPVVEINTQDEVLPYNKEDYINCSFQISNCDEDDYNFEVSMKDNYGDDDSVGIRLRGNSTQWMTKKPYRIKFDKKKSLFGLTKNKSWVLLADYLDQSAVRNYSAFTLGSMMENLDFTPTPNHVVLFINGYYKGLYLLCEQVDEKEGRANVEEDILATDTSFPFLVEMDRNALSEGVTGVDNFQPDYYWPIEIKYPEAEDRIEGDTDVVFNYIQEYINAVFTTLNTNEAIEVSFSEDPVIFEDLVDVDSFIEYWLVNEIMFNQDSTWGSIYIHKTKDGKLKFGPNWDFDWSMSNNYTGIPYNTSFIECASEFCILKYNTPLRAYAKNQDGFNKICEKWDEIKSYVLDTANFLKDYKGEIKSVAHYDANYWYGETGAFQFEMQYDYVRLFLLDRYEFLDSQLIEENYNNLFGS